MDRFPLDILYSFKHVTKHRFHAHLGKPRVCFQRTLPGQSKKLTYITVKGPGSKDLTPEQSLILVLSCINRKNSVKSATEEKGSVRISDQKSVQPS